MMLKGLFNFITKSSSLTDENSKQELELLIRYPSKFFILNENVNTLKDEHKFYLREFSEPKVILG